LTDKINQKNVTKRGQNNHDFEDQAFPSPFGSSLVPIRALDQYLRAIWIEDGLFLAVFRDTCLEIVDNSIFPALKGKNQRPRAHNSYKNSIL